MSKVSITIPTPKGETTSFEFSGDAGKPRQSVSLEDVSAATRDGANTLIHLTTHFTLRPAETKTYRTSEALSTVSQTFDDAGLGNIQTLPETKRTRVARALLSTARKFTAV